MAHEMEHCHILFFRSFHGNVGHGAVSRILSAKLWDLSWGAAATQRLLFQHREAASIILDGLA